MTAWGERARTLLIASAVLAALLWLALGLTSSDAVLGQGMVHAVIKTLAIITTALFAVVAVGGLVLSRALSGADGEPTGLLRVVVYGVLTFAASSVTLSYFGFDLRAVLTTSAIVTAAVGFAMQPTLGSMISGLALHMDRVLRVGDVIMHGGEPVQITGLNWRTVVGRASNGRLVVFPNARLSDTPLEVVQYDRPSEASFYFLAGAQTPPQQVRELATELMVDLPLVEASLPLHVAPTSYRPRHRALRYRVKYWVTDLIKADEVEGEAHHRLWYAFQRQKIPYPLETEWLTGTAPAAEPWPAPEDLAARIAAALGRAQEPLHQEMAQRGDYLMFASHERLIMPERTAGQVFLLLYGEALSAPEFANPPVTGRLITGGRVSDLGRTAAIKQVAEDLADYIGPYAEYAVHRAAETVHDFTALCRLVALEITDPAARERFLEGVCPPGERRAGPGTLLHARRNAAGSLVCGGGLRARGEAGVLALPPEFAAKVGEVTAA